MGIQNTANCAGQRGNSERFWHKTRESLEIQDFTGIDGSYEAPVHPEIRIDTVRHSAEENARYIESYLVGRGYLAE
jgi:adenylylsulfate kinase-like enzyme